MEPPRLTWRQRANPTRAFTILELLAVMVIIAILFSITGMIAGGPIDSMKLTEAAQNLSHELARARQHAMTQNREVEFRIYRTDPHEEESLEYRSFAYGIADIVTDPNDPEYEDPTAANFSPPFVPVNNRTNLQAGHLFLDTDPYSTLITGQSGAVQDVRTGTETRTDGTSADYVAFTFLPEGRAALDTDKKWTLTVIRENDKKREGSELRQNFATILLQPESGRARSYRP